MIITNLTDIGVNLLSPAFNRDREEILARAEAVGVKTLIITGSSLDNSAEVLNYVKNHFNCYSTAGVHPHNAKDWNAQALIRLGEIISCGLPGHIVAAGECGLDYNRNYSSQDAQRKCFEEQLAFAAKIKLPVFLHERDAFPDFYSLLKKYRRDLSGVVVHCFTGTAEELNAYLALDCYIGITGWLCDERRGGHLIPLLRHIPEDRLLLETDAPYLLPRHIRVKSGRNEPCFLPYIASFAAQILGKTPALLAEQTSANAMRLFRFYAVQAK